VIIDRHTNPKEIALNTLLTAIEDYLRQEEIDYALLLKGPWGCGKTYFFKHEITDLINGPLKGRFIPIYVSLYGIDRIEDISKRLYLALHPSLQSKKLAKGLEVFKAISSVQILGFSLGGKSWEFDAEKWITLDKDYLLCFDDLERCQIECASVLGYINQFVEQDHIKTVIIANETEIPEEQRPAYDKIKEKVIGRTYEIELDFKTIVDSIIATAAAGEGFKDFLKSHEEIILGIVKKSGNKNIRILKHGIGYYHKVYLCLRLQEGLFTVYAPKLLLFTLSICCEIMSGSADREALRSISPGLNFRMQLQLGSLEKNKKDYLKTLYDKYFSANDDLFHFSQAVLHYIESGYFDEDMFKNEIQELIEKPEEPDVILRKSILDEYYKLTDAEFKTNTQKLLRQIVNGAVPINLYNQLFAYYEYFSNRKMIPEDKDVLLRKFTSGYQRAFKKLDQEKRSAINIPDMDIDKRSEEYKTFVKSIDSIRAKATDDAQRKLYREIFELLPGDVKQFRDILHIDGEGFSVKPVFAHYDPIRLRKKVLNLSNSDLHVFLGIIRYRYKTLTNIKSFLSEERDNLLKLKSAIQPHIRAKNRRLKDSLLEGLVKEIDDAAAILNEGKANA
jgi:hypothetical protein